MNALKSSTLQGSDKVASHTSINSLLVAPTCRGDQAHLLEWTHCEEYLPRFRRRLGGRENHASRLGGSRSNNIRQEWVLNLVEDNVQKTLALVFWNALTLLKVIPSLYLASSTETRYNNQSPGKDRFHEFRYSHKPRCTF